MQRRLAPGEGVPGRHDAARLHEARLLLQCGRPAEALPWLREAAAAPVPDLEALTALGAAYVMCGNLTEAEPVMRRAMQARPDLPHLHGNLGTLLRDMGRLHDAERCLAAALRHHPDDPGLHSNLGAVLNGLGRQKAAERSFRRALQHQPGHAAALANLGLLLNATGRHAEAAQACTEFLQAHPGRADVCFGLGVALRSLGRLQHAEASLHDALRHDPGHAGARFELGAVLHSLGRPAEAAVQFRRVLETRQDMAEAHAGLGIAANLLGRYAEAEACLATAIRQRPDMAEAHNSMGDTLRNLGRLADAEASLQEALRLRPSYAEAQVSLAFTYLQAGRYADGWRLHEGRWRASGWRGRARPSGPAWQGEPLDGRSLLLFAEQGLGDTLQFCRYASLVPAGGRVSVQVQPPLMRLLRSLPGIEAVHAAGTPARFDVQQSLMSLPHVLGTSLGAVPATVPYLRAEAADVAEWQGRVSGLPGLRVGLAWAGDPTMAADARRSVALAALAPLGAVGGVSFVSLQLGPAAAQAPPAGLALHDFSMHLRDFADTAAAVSVLDLVIAVDTAVIHLAGALGRPAWLLNRHDTCWRWLAAGSGSPWYPTLRVFRQPAPGQWAPVIANVRDALQGLAGSR